jgi:hypothetical protein
VDDDVPRSRVARNSAEAALVRVVRHFGSLPQFVVLGGLVPDLLCAGAPVRHAGTTDVDVQVDLEIAQGSVNTVRLEHALLKADFRPDNERIWRWESREDGIRAVVKFELLSDLDDTPAGATVRFDGCENLGAANLRGTRFAARDRIVRELVAGQPDEGTRVAVYVTGLAGFLLAKCAAAYGRRKPKDWYDIAFVLLHNEAGGPSQAAESVTRRFAAELTGEIGTAVRDLAANFADPRAQGPSAYVDQLIVDHSDHDPEEAAIDAVTAVQAFCSNLGLPAWVPTSTR